jgi:hypothetical protein
MKKKINWGHVAYGVLSVMNAALSIHYAIHGNYEAACGWMFTALYILSYRLEVARSNYYRKARNMWKDAYNDMEEAYRSVVKSIAL